MMNVFTAVVLLSFMISSSYSNATVTLSSSADSLCPGDGVVFTCVTDTGRLKWDIGPTVRQLYYNAANQLNDPATKDIFTLTLQNVTGNITFQSTASAMHVPLNYSKQYATCEDGTNVTKLKIAFEPPPSQPLNLTSSSNLSTVTISWVAPLDTPLCVHSYTVTVRNSSQVMVYNTTDNRSSLSITDLTSDGEYSVTVAGRDGAGRLGQESEELKINLSLNGTNTEEVQSECSVAITKHVLVFGKRFRGVLIKWTVYLNSMAYCSFQITHNVSSDQSPITTNRTNVTLYGVEPGETYTVSVGTISRIKLSFLETISIRIEHEPICAFPDHNQETHFEFSLGFIMSFISGIVLLVTLCGYMLMCLCTSFSKNTDTRVMETDIAIDNPTLFHTESQNCHQRTRPASSTLSYDYVRHSHQ